MAMKVDVSSEIIIHITEAIVACYRRMEMHHCPEAFDFGSATVTDPTSSTAVRHTSTLFRGTTNVLDSKKKSPPLATVTGDVLVMVPV